MSDVVSWSKVQPVAVVAAKGSTIDMDVKLDHPAAFSGFICGGKKLELRELRLDGLLTRFWCLSLIDGTWIACCEARLLLVGSVVACKLYAREAVSTEIEFFLATEEGALRCLARLAS